MQSGIPKNISICYRENEVRYLFAILKSKPSSSVFVDYDEFRDDIVGACELFWNSLINLDTVLYQDYKNPNDYDNRKSSLGSVLENATLVDTSTGWELDVNSFKNNEFYLNRNYILYMIYISCNDCLLSDIYKKTGINKQTINSAIRKLEDDGILFLEQYKGRNKKIVLTDNGKVFLSSNVSKLYEAEAKAFDSWSEDEIQMYIRLMEKYALCLRKEVDKL